SKFSGALELLTLGELIFFDTGRSELVRVDHFDVLRPFARVREDLERLGQAAWMAECVGRLTAERDPNVAVYGLLLRALKALEAGAPPRRVAVVFGVRLMDALGHRLRVDACVGCGRRDVFGRGPLIVDVEAGGLVCEACANAVPGLLRLGSGSVATLRRLRGLAWDYGPLGVELKNNIKRVWWRDNIHLRPDMVGLDASILMHPQVWKASGHLDHFTDPMVDCKACQHRFRADKVEEQSWIHYCPAT